MLSMLCRMFKKKSLSGNARFECCRASKFENELVSQYVPIHFGVLIQQVCNPDFDRNMQNHLNITYPNRWIGRGGPVLWAA